MIRRIKQACCDEFVDVIDANRTVSNSLFAVVDLDQRLQPGHSPGAIAYDLDLVLFRGRRDSLRDLVCPK